MSLAEATTAGAPVFGPQAALDAAGLGAARAVTRLEGGLLNFTWRVHLDVGSVIVKHAPPFVAARPELSLDPQRQDFEAAALRLLGPDGPLSGLCSEEARPPHLVFHDPDEHWLIMEDLGPLSDLATRVARGEGAPQGRALGAFIGRLHAQTRGQASLAAGFANVGVQATRFAVQYAPAGEQLRLAGVRGAAGLGAKLLGLGQRLQGPGACLVMGDLWPASVLCAPEGVRLIDWELSTYGQPAQDLGHLMAWLRMLAHRAATAEAAQAAEQVGEAFLAAYREAAGPLCKAERADCALHFAAELLTRSVGAFVEGGPYAGLAPSHPAAQEIVGVAVAHLIAPGAVRTFAGLA
ncbi:MAG: phosphotransferase [Alphaproteobacteria bacterium]|nr:phosphotransferase [Alphaproteobacteria bacterium]